MEPPKAIGIECVGSHFSVSACVAESGTVLNARVIPLTINFFELTEFEVARRVFEIVRMCLSETGSGDTISSFFGRGGTICAGITGITTEHDRTKGVTSIWELLEFPATQCLGTGDAEVLLSGETLSLRGAVIVWHSGSVVYVRNGKTSRGIRVGGWGPVVGDEGSAYYIGRAALHALTWHRNRFKMPCVQLAQDVRRHLDESPYQWGHVWRALRPSPLSAGDDWIDYLVLYMKELAELRITRAAISDLVPAVVSAAQAETDDGGRGGVAARIIEKSLTHLTERLEIAIGEAGLGSGGINIVLSGGVAARWPYLTEKIKQRISSKYPEANVHLPPIDQVYHTGSGAVLHAMSRSFDLLPPQSVCQAVRNGLVERLSTQKLPESFER